MTETSFLSATTLYAIVAERQSQDRKYNTKNQDQEVWMDVLAEEFGEVARARLEKNSQNLQLELIQVAATTVAIIEDCKKVSSAEALSYVNAFAVRIADLIDLVDQPKLFLRLGYWLGQTMRQAEHYQSGVVCVEYINSAARTGAIAAVMLEQLTRGAA